MSVSPTSSSIYINYTSLFSQGGNRTLSSFQAAAASYANGSYQVRSASVSAMDILDLSPEALNWTKPAADTTETEATEDAAVQETSEADRVETIRLNKNAVLNRVKELLSEKGVEVSEDQAFDLKANFLDGSISVTGVEDAELEAAMNEALAGDEELTTLMRKTRDELGLPEQENTVPRNFTIEFDSMLETPADAELEFRIDLFVNRSQPLLEDGSAEAEATEDEITKPADFQMSILLSNRGVQQNQPSLLDQLADNADNAKTKNNGKTDRNAKAENDTEENEDPDVVAKEELVEKESVPENDYEDDFSIFSDWFRADSTIVDTPEGPVLHWSMQWSNWNVSGNMNSPNDGQQLFETLSIGGSTPLNASNG